MEKIIKEKISADHLLYVSLKYTKTCDVIKNLLLRWGQMIEVSVNAVLEKAEENKKIKEVPASPLGKIEEAKKLFKDDKKILKVLDFYIMIRKIETLRTERIGEFRKNVNLKIFYRGKEISVNLEQLKIYAELLENFIKTVKLYLSE